MSFCRWPLYREFAPYIAAALGVVIIGYLFWPGFMSYDSIWQLQQARHGIAGSQHPPMMTYIWRFLDRLYPGPGLMLLLQLSLFYFSLAAILRILLDSAWRAAILVLVSIPFHPVLGLLGNIWKDIGLMCFFQLSFLALLLFQQRRTWVRAAAFIIFLFLAVSYRHNALFGALPLAGYFAGLCVSIRPQLSTSLLWVQRTAVSGLVILAVWLPTVILNTVLTTPTFPSLIALWDVLAISRHTGTNLLPPFSFADRPNFGSAEIIDLYRPAASNYAYIAGLQAEPLNPRHDPIIRVEPLRLPANQQDVDEIRRAWAHAVLKYPLVYLRHRLAILAVFLGIGRAQPFYVSHYGIDANELGVIYRPNRLQRGFVRYLQELYLLKIYKPIWWHLAAFLILVVLVQFRSQHRIPLFVLFSSGMFYWLLSLPLYPSADYRYQSWTMTASTLIVLYTLGLLFGRLTGAQNDKASIHP